jgi:hypothetical protein
MKKSHQNTSNNPMRMELKYCEHCGSLWLRPSGAETVYCDICQPKVAELPPPKKNPGRVQLPIARTAVVERYDNVDDLMEIDPDEFDFEAAGGVA